MQAWFLLIHLAPDMRSLIDSTTRPDSERKPALSGTDGQESLGRDRISLDLSPGGVARVLAVIIIALVAAHVVVHVLELLKYGLNPDQSRSRLMGLVSLFDLNEERNLPTFVSAALLVLGALGFYLLHRMDESGKPSDRHWVVLSALFVFLAADEAMSIHDSATLPLREALDASGIFYYTWVVPYASGVLILTVYLLPRILRIAREIRWLFLAAAGMYVLGALGCEFLEGLVGSRRLAIDRVVYLLVSNLLTTSEETLEMAGLVTLIYAQLRLLGSYPDEFRIRFRQPGPTSHGRV